MEEELLKAKVVNISDETYDVKTFRFVKLDGGKFDFLPGQFVFLYADIPVDGKLERVKRAYSIASSPTDSDYLELTLKLYPHGKMTTHFHSHVKLGDVFELSAPLGKFTYEEENGKKIVLVVGGSGIVPMRSIARYCTEKNLKTDMTLLYSTKVPEDIIYGKELKDLEKTNPFLKSYITITRNTERWDGRKGRIDEEMIKDSVEDYLGSIYYICGPLEFIRGVAGLLKGMGVDRTKIKRDVWA
jgi:ferredoxin-NADP reductase